MVNFGQIKPISRSIRQKKKIYYQIKFPSLHTFSCDGKIFSHFPLSLSLARFLLLTSKKLYCCCASLTKRHFYPTADAAADEIYFFVCMSNKLLSVCVCVSRCYLCPTSTRHEEGKFDFCSSSMRSTNSKEKKNNAESSDSWGTRAHESHKEKRREKKIERKIFGFSTEIV